MKYVVTGGRGFIGSHFVERLLQLNHEVVDIDNMTYAANETLPWDNHPKYTHIKEDIAKLKKIPLCDYVVNFAAESHVDNSIIAPDIFVRSNVVGTHNILKLLRAKIYDRPMFIHISTDEVYGEADPDGAPFKETNILLPGNPYAASKAAAEMLVMAYSKTYGVDYIITRSTNNYGNRQYEEKLIPHCIKRLEQNRKICLHGDGTYIRDWLYVKDNVEAILTIINSNVKNEIYNIAAQNLLTNNFVAKSVAGWFEKSDPEKHIEYVINRLGQDTRYTIDASKVKQLGWRPANKSGLKNFLKEE